MRGDRKQSSALARGEKQSGEEDAECISVADERLSKRDTTRRYSKRGLVKRLEEAPHAMESVGRFRAVGWPLPGNRGKKRAIQSRARRRATIFHSKGARDPSAACRVCRPTVRITGKRERERETYV